MWQSTILPKPGKRVHPRRVLIIFGVIYLLACLGCAVWQRRLLYFPPVFTAQQASVMAADAKLERWRNSAGEYIGMKRMSSNQPAAGRVLITYGNGSCAIGSARYADVIQKVAPLDVYILEYPGYADRLCSPSQESIFRAAEEAFQLLPTNGPIYLVGESLGTGVSCYLAGSHPDKVAGVVLFAPYNRLADVAQYHMWMLPAKLILVDRFASEDYLRNFRGPVGILVAGQDTVVPEKFGRRLYDGYAGPKKLWEFPEANHGTVTERTAADWTNIIDFWRGR